MDPWITFNKANKLPHMDGGLCSTATTGDVTIELGGDPVTFHGMDLAPACGMMGQNYYRCGSIVQGATALLTSLCFLLARGSHNEKQPHPFAIQWLLRRNKGATAGAHFYITSYGTKIVNSSNTLIAWQPWHWHGTSLGDWDPEDPYPDFQQLGIAFVTPPRLAKVYEGYAEAFKHLWVETPFDSPESLQKRAAEAAALLRLHWLHWTRPNKRVVQGRK